MRPRDYVQLLALASLWGAAFLFIRIAGPEIGAIPVAALRALIGGIALWLLAVARGEPRGWGKRTVTVLTVGAIGIGVPGMLVTQATLFLNASLTSVLTASTPIFTAAIAAIWLRESLSLRQVFGLLIGIGGVVVLVGFSPIGLSQNVVVGAGMATLATLGWALGGILTNRLFTGMSLISLAAGQQFGAAMVTVPLAIASRPDRLPSVNGTLAILAIALPCTALAFILYFDLLRRVGATRASSVTYLIPVTGLTWGVLFLDEPLTIATILALGVILSGIALTAGGRRRSADQDDHGRTVPVHLKAPSRQ